MAEYWGVKVGDIFNTMPERFREEGARDVDASFGYDIAGEGKWKITVKGGTLKVEKIDDLSGCASIMLCDGETFVGVNTGKVDSVNAFTSGKVKVEGDFGAFGKTAKMFKKFVIGRKEMSTKDYILDMFGSLVSRFQPQNAKDLNATITYQIGGEGGGVWTATIKDGTCELKEGHVEKPTVRLEVNEASDWVDVMLGKTDPFSLLSAGRAAIAGETALALKLGEIFAKYQPPSSTDGEPEQELIVLKKTIAVNQRFATGPVMGRFLNALKEKKIFGTKCPTCGRIQLPAREVCADCRVRADEWVEVGPKGQVRYMEYVYYASPDPLTGETRETPYGMLNILLDGCGGNDTFAHLVRRDQLDLIKGGHYEISGTRVRPVWSDKRVGSIFDIKYFEIDE
ncbi:MAG TPA: SCP2 sterol-binding domain-containing protein [Spirochaetota bacterium]|nr:SCP2 sterol-binding domain-containing protein [Spirochaetota bacterium]